MPSKPAPPDVLDTPTPGLLAARGLLRRHGDTPVFQGVDLQVQAGEFVAIVGDSGVGKSTLLNALAGLEKLQSGEVLLQGHRVDLLGDEALSRLRREHLGFVFQAFHVLPHLSVRQNVALPLMLLQQPDAADRKSTRLNSSHIEPSRMPSSA